ncbi:hypothetical protein V6Z11_A02G082600 [Gossypium hirsutum]|uniref:Uncharacterized protein n=1 Tax=Gossypium hirsutum TaxID=3635 RepID=A0A1U8NWN6_GOSHI|nr:uncharacterized protein LOC107952574 [Gossypium hirsutum]
MHGGRRVKTLALFDADFSKPRGSRSITDVCALIEPTPDRSARRSDDSGVIYASMVAGCTMAESRNHGALGGDDWAIESARDERSRRLECPKLPELYCGAEFSGNPRVSLSVFTALGLLGPM